MKTLAIDVGGTKYSMAVFDGDQMIARLTERTDREGGRDWMLSRIEWNADQWRYEYGFDRIGIGFGGPVDFPTQTITLSTHVGGWSNTPLVNILSSRYDVPAIMDNDANVGALGEGFHGAGLGFRPLFYMTLSTGIGGGILLADSTVHRGADSYGGEIGHLTIVPGGPECLCGSRGCFERMCCGLWLERDHGKSAEELMQSAEFVEQYVVQLAMGLKACVMLLNPARIVIGGGISKAGDRLFVPLREELRRQVTKWSRARLDVVPAALGDDSVLYGALALAGSL
ncbi:MAG TPA: ROK family protein [Bryobacteraceae bacterium]|jgi:glucokinase